MATEANKLKVGSFLIAGFLLFNAALVWIGTSRVLEKTERFVTFFDESVHGLEIGSAVKFRGVDVGRVASIGVAPDGRLVEVRMDLARGLRTEPGLRASLTTSGLTGISIVELGYPREGMAPPPELSFTAPDRYIPSQPSLMTSLTSALSEVADGLRGTDFAGLVAEYRSAAAAARKRLEAPEIDQALARLAGAAAALDALAGRLAELAEDPRIARTLERLDAAAGHVEGAARSAESLVGDPRIAQTLDDARAAAAAARLSIEEVRAEVATFRAGERLDAVQRRVEVALDGVDDSARTAAAGVLETSRAATSAAAGWERLAAGLDRSVLEVLTRLERAADRVENLAASIEADPSRLFAKPPKEDFR